MVPLTARFGVFYLLSLSVSAATSILTSSTTVSQHHHHWPLRRGGLPGRGADEKAKVGRAHLPVRVTKLCLQLYNT